jgi:hypothetical protein
MSRELQIIRTGRDRALTFEDLPPELRLRIYEYALTSPDWIEIRVRRDPAKIDLAIQHASWRYFGLHAEAKELLRKRDLLRLWDEDRSCGVSKVDEYSMSTSPRAKARLSSQLLRVSRLVNREATPILYGLNRLAFVDCQFPDSLFTADRHVKHLRHIKISVHMGHQISVKTVVRSLKLAHSLRSLEFRSCPAADLKTSVKSMANHLKGWAGRIMKDQQRRLGENDSRASDIASIIRFSGSETIDTDAYTAQVRTALEELLSQKAKPRQAKNKTV